MADKRKTFLWICGLIVLSLAIAILQLVVNFDEYYCNGYEAGKKAGLNIGYYIGEEDGAKAGGKQGTAAGELLLQFADVTFDSEAHEIPKAKIEAPDSKKIFVSAGIMALIPSYAEGYREGYISAANDGYTYGYKNGYKENYKQTYWFYEAKAEEKLADELATVYTVPEGSSDENKNPASESEGNREAPPQYYAPVAEKCDYVLNKNTMKFHYPSCSSASQIKESNREYFTGERAEVIARGFSPCGRCHP